MNPDRYNSKTIFLIFMIVAVLGYFIMPRVQQNLPLMNGKTIADLDAMAIPNEKMIISEREILSRKSVEDDEISQPPSYLVCVINDDPDGTNAYGIYDPTDLAVTVRNLVRLNTKHLFLGTHLHWPDLPVVENNTLNSQLELLESCIISTPLRRGADAMDVPDYLLDSSVALAEVNGDVLTLPKVNNLTLAPTLRIPSNCKVGFSQLESEPKTSGMPLLAVWDDRVILSSLLLERMHHLNLTPKDIKISLGESFSSISLGDTGNIIPIDAFGYFTPTEIPEIYEPHIISAEITSVKEPPVDSVNAILTASGVEADNYRAIEDPVRQLTQLANTPVYQEQLSYLRIWWWVELFIAIIVGFLLSLAVRLPVIIYWLWISVLLASIIIVSISLSITTTYYLPISYLAIALIICAIVFPFLKRRANFIEELIDNQDDIGDISLLYKQEHFSKNDISVAKLSARDRKHLREKNKNK